MFDIDTLTTIGPIIAGFATLLVLTRLLGGTEPGDLAAMFGRQSEPTWPRGVQEEEPFSWHVDRLDARPAARVRLRALAPAADCDECADEAAA